jgi:hypothetical protein
MIEIILIRDLLKINFSNEEKQDNKGGSLIQRNCDKVIQDMISHILEGNNSNDEYYIKCLNIQAR